MDSEFLTTNELTWPALIQDLAVNPPTTVVVTPTHYDGQTGPENESKEDLFSLGASQSSHQDYQLFPTPMQSKIYLDKVWRLGSMPRVSKDIELSLTGKEKPKTIAQFFDQRD